MLELLTALALMTADGKPGADRLENGRYGAIGTDGEPACEDDHAADHFHLYALDRPPYHRSPNLGDMRFRIDGQPGGFILHSTPRLDATADDGRRTVSLTGGRVHAVGVELDGVLSSPTIGRFTATLSVDPQGRVWIEAMGFDPERGGGEVATYVREGAPAGPFGYCG